MYCHQRCSVSDLLPSCDESDGCFQILERASTDLAGDVVAHTAAFAGFVYNHHSSSLLHRFRQLCQGQRIDGPQVDQLDVWFMCR